MSTTFTPPAAEHDGLAIASLVSAFFVSPAAIVLGHMSNYRAKKAGRPKSGLAIAGLILGYIGTIGGILLLVISLAAASSVQTQVDQPAGQPAVATAPAAPAAPVAPATTAALGHTFTVSTTHLGGDPWYTLRIRLDKMTEPAQPDPASDIGGTNLSAASAGHHLAAATVTWTVTADDMGDGVTPSSIGEFSAVGSDGRHYTPGIGYGAADNIDNVAGVMVGESDTGTVSFEIPDGVRLTMVRYSPIGGDAAYTWTVPAHAVQSAAVQHASGSDTVRQFYRDINARDYQAAWKLGGSNLSGGSGYDAWVAGYATTASVTVTASDTSGGVVQVTISAVQDNGSVRTYAGTYTVRNGVITSASIAQTS